MKKLFVIFIIVLIPLTTFAQEKIIADINNQINSNIHKMTKQELNSKVVSEWGEKELKFLELKNGKLIPMSVEKSKNLSKTQDAQDVEPWVYVVIVVGIVIIVVLIIAVIAMNIMKNPLKK